MADWYGIVEAGKILGVSERTVRRRIGDKELKSEEIDGVIKVWLEVESDTEADRLREEVAELKVQSAELIRQLGEKDRVAAEDRVRTDTIILQATRQTQLLLEDNRRSFWDRWRKKVTEAP